MSYVGLLVRSDAAGLIRGDAPDATGVTEVEVISGPDGADYRGEAVYGRRGKRFLYLTWGTVQDQEFSMFRRAKVLLSDLATTPSTEGSRGGERACHAGERIPAARPGSR